MLYQALTWPDVAGLRRANPTTTAFIERYQDRRRAAGESERVAWHWVPATAISPNLKRAVVAAEDLEFFSHNGFSASEARAALRKAIAELELPRGASTITQQLAKNLWLSPSRNPLRKLKEALLTRQLERRLSKDRILDIYLNVVEFGRGIYGAEAAARHYFGKPAAALTESQAAQLAASLPRPSSWHPGVESRSYRGYVADIERRMERATFLLQRVRDAEPESSAAEAPRETVVDSTPPDSGAIEDLPADSSAPAPIPGQP
jgi:monofunctional biosynthetic peptidoglycan transglycosylase